jgi:DNA-binding winged helix-turn-helix (wHTH) protein/TolB-like protein/Tfp pilus assembly protein PilF
MSEKESRLYEFDRFCLDPSERVLLCDQQEAPLTPKVFETLLLLVENSGRIVGKEELMKAIWPDNFVEESSLAQNISLLRKALGDGIDGRRFIETVPKRGYRFIAPVRVVNKGAQADEELAYHSAATEAALKEENECHTGRQEEAAPRTSLQLTSLAFPANLNSGRKVAVVVTIVLLAVAGGIYLWVAKMAQTRDEVSANSGNRVRSLAALPFKPLSNESRDEFLGLGMADALILKLGGFNGLTVLTTGSIAQYTGRGHDAREVGKRLGVDAVIEGTIQHDDGRVRVTATLLDLRGGKILWSGKFDEKFTDMFALQDSISEKVSGALKLQLATGGAQPTRRFTASLEAYQMYLMGLYFCNKDTPEGLSKAVEYFRQATEKDSGYALAFAMLADTYAIIARNCYDFMTRDELREKAQVAVAKARELDGSLPEAVAAVGLVKEQFEGDLEGAEQMYRRAIELNPGFGVVYLIYANLLLKKDRLEESIEHMQRAHEFDPISPVINSNLSFLHRLAHRPDEALKYSRIALEIEPNYLWARANQGEAYEAKGMYQEAAAEYQKLAEMERFSLYGKHKLIYLYAMMGRRDEAQKLFAETQMPLQEGKATPQEMFTIALAHVALGLNDKAFEWLNRAAESRGITYCALQRIAKLDPLRSDPRFESLRRRLESNRGLSVPKIPSWQ